MTIQKNEAFDPAFTFVIPSNGDAPVPLTTLSPSLEPEPPDVVEHVQAPELELSPQKPVPADANLKPTKETYDRLQQAFDHFNRTLFGGTLPNPLFTYQRRRNTVGYFSPAKFARADGTKADEIALNPTLCAAMPLPELLSFMVHDMVHLWQHRNGAPGRGRYHNREWAEKMKTIGLHPTATGQEGGQETGEAIMHMIVPGGPFAQAADRLLGKGFAIEWREVLSPPDEAKGESVNRLAILTPDRRRILTPLATRGGRPDPAQRSGWRRRIRPSSGPQARFLKRQLSFPVSTMSQ